MNFTQESFNDYFYGDNYNNLSSILDFLQSLLHCNVQNTDSVSSDLVSTEFLEELKYFMCDDNVSFYFGKTLRELKCIIKEEAYSRKHEIFIQYKSHRKLVITQISLPYTSLQDREYNTIEDIVTTFRQHLEDLSSYFHELECIDRSCTVMEPVNPSFKEDYRRIVLDDRTWLHIEVTSDGSATNIHLIGQSEYWQNKLQEGLLKWDHDVDIIRNIMHIFDITEFPTLTNRVTMGPNLEDREPMEKPVCRICLCDELPDIPGVPLPLCQNSTCGIYFHRTCLFEWLVACAGGRLPAFGVATGSCPTCLQPIACNEKDS